MVKINFDDTHVYINIGGYVTRDIIVKFVGDYKQLLREIKPSRYILVIEPKEFFCEEDEYVKKVFKMFMKSGFRKIYLVDNFGITNGLKLSKIERNFFKSKINIVSSIEDIY